MPIIFGLVASYFSLVEFFILVALFATIGGVFTTILLLINPPLLSGEQQMLSIDVDIFVIVTQPFFVRPELAKDLLDCHGLEVTELLN